MSSSSLPSRRTVLRAAAAAPLAAVFAVRPAAAAVDPAAVFGDAAAPVLGNPRGDVTIATWFDYQCPWCKKVEPDLMKVVAADGRVRVLMKDWPIFGEVSTRISRAVWSTRRQGRYEAAHAAFMGLEGRPDPNRIDATLAAAGVDLGRLAADIEADRAAYDALVGRNGEQAEGFGFMGTPAYVVGPFVFPGVIEAAGFRQAIADARRAAHR